jgi:hypothetical protein
MSDIVKKQQEKNNLILELRKLNVFTICIGGVNRIISFCTIEEIQKELERQKKISENKAAALIIIAEREAAIKKQHDEEEPKRQEVLAQLKAMGRKSAGNPKRSMYCCSLKILQEELENMEKQLERKCWKDNMPKFNN